MASGYGLHGGECPIETLDPNRRVLVSQAAPRPLQSVGGTPR
jgi:hypothetical protein